MPHLTPHRTAAKTERKTPETLRLTGIIPSLIVNDIHRSLLWYRDVLGFHVKAEWNREEQLAGVLLQAGSAQLMIEQRTVSRQSARSPRDGVHIYCTTRQDVEMLARLVGARGITLADPPASQPGGGHEFAVVDPDGFRITITCQS